jgi:bacterioferritin-associated ferredoxin
MTRRASMEELGGHGYTAIARMAVVYVCLCNALTDRQVKQAATAAGTVRPSMIYAACGCRAQCGQCVKALVLLLRGPDPAMPEPQGAD